MSTTTENYNLIIPEGDDLFAPLNVEAPNFRSIDSNMWDNRLAGIQAATELISGSVHAITRDTPDAPMFRYTATGGVNSGDTFTVDGIAVQAVLPNGMAIEAGAYIEGCEVLAAVVGSKMTLYIGAGSGDADTLEGHPASYFGTAQRTEEVAALAQAANTTANAANQTAQDAQNTANEALSLGGMKATVVWTNPDPTQEVPTSSTFTLSGVPSNVKFFIVKTRYNTTTTTITYNSDIVFPGGSDSERSVLKAFYGIGSSMNDATAKCRSCYINGNTFRLLQGPSDYKECIPVAVYAIS